MVTITSLSCKIATEGVRKTKEKLFLPSKKKPRIAFEPLGSSRKIQFINDDTSNSYTAKA